MHVDGEHASTGIIMCAVLLLAGCIHIYRVLHSAFGPFLCVGRTEIFPVRQLREKKCLAMLESREHTHMTQMIYGADALHFSIHLYIFRFFFSIHLMMSVRALKTVCVNLFLSLHIGKWMCDHCELVQVSESLPNHQFKLINSCSLQFIRQFIRILWNDFADFIFHQSVHWCFREIIRYWKIKVEKFPFPVTRMEKKRWWSLN